MGGKSSEVLTELIDITVKNRGVYLNSLEAFFTQFVYFCSFILLIGYAFNTGIPIFEIIDLPQSWKVLRELRF